MSVTYATEDMFYPAFVCLSVCLSISRMIQKVVGQISTQSLEGCNLRRLQAHTKTFAAMIRDLLYADDCALLARSEADAQHLFDRFYRAYSSITFRLNR